MREYGGAAITRGLTDEVVLDFLQERADLALAIERGYDAFLAIRIDHDMDPDAGATENGVIASLAELPDRI